MDVNVILIHIGSIYPTHINDCIEQLKKFNITVHLILSEILIKEVPFNDLLISSVEDYVGEKYNSFRMVGFDNNFRDGFWTSTSSRFFILENYTKKNKINNFYHIEHDNLIYNDLKNITKILIKKNKELFIVIDSDYRCIPSILFINNNEILGELSDFILLNNNKNDMENLINFYFSNKERVGNLPILPSDNDLELVSKTGIKTNNTIDYSNMFDELQIIFDGAAIGQFIGGVDPRNDNSNTIGFVNETTIFDVSKMNILWDNNPPLVELNNKKTKICNLHIHSKNLKKFK
jgi:hypothetical protein